MKPKELESVNMYSHIKEEEEDNDGHGKHTDHVGSSSFTTAAFQIANTIMGAGILSLPMVMQNLGLILGTTFILAVALCTIYSVKLLLSCKDITERNGYSIFAKICYGRRGSLGVKIVIMINNFGLCCAYFKIFGQVSLNIAKVFCSADSFFVENWHNFIYILLIFFIMFFLIYKESIESLKGASILGVLGICIFFVCLIILYIYKVANNLIPKEKSYTSLYLWPNGKAMDIIACLPTVFLAFTFQFNAFPVYLTNEEMMKATSLGVGLCLVLYIITGVVGYLMYGSECTASILGILGNDMKNFRDNDKFIVTILLIVNISFMISSTMSIPLMFFTLKKNLINSVIFCKKKFVSNKINHTEIHVNPIKDSKIESLKERDDMSLNFSTQDSFHFNYKPPKIPKEENTITTTTRIILTTVVYILICFVTIVIPSLDIIFNIVGSTAANAISFIMPNLFLLKLSKTLFCSTNHNASKCLLIFGIFILIMCLVGEIVRTIKK